MPKFMFDGQEVIGGKSYPSAWERIDYASGSNTISVDKRKYDEIAFIVVNRGALVAHGTIVLAIDPGTTTANYGFPMVDDTCTYMGKCVITATKDSSDYTKVKIGKLIAANSSHTDMLTNDASSIGLTVFGKSR